MEIVLILQIINMMDLRLVDKGEIMVAQDEPASEFMVIIKGAASVFQNGAKIRSFGAWDVLGEGALIYEDHKRGATVIADVTTQVLVLTRDSYKKLLLSGIIAQKTNERAKRMSTSYSTQDKERLAAARVSDSGERVTEEAKSLVSGSVKRRGTQTTRV